MTTQKNNTAETGKGEVKIGKQSNHFLWNVSSFPTVPSKKLCGPASRCMLKQTSLDTRATEPAVKLQKKVTKKTPKNLTCPRALLLNEDVMEAAGKNGRNAEETGCSELVSSGEKRLPGDISEMRT